MTVHDTIQDPVRAARRVAARALSAALADPRAPHAADGAGAGALVERTWELLAAVAAGAADGPLAPGERLPVPADARGLRDWLDAPADLRERVHQQVFGLVLGRDCPPCETEYLPWKDPTHRAQHLADGAGFYLAHGVRPGARLPERHDHVSVQLGFVALLHEKLARTEGTAGTEGAAGADAADEHRAVCESSLRSFLADHVAWWVPTFAELLRRRIRRLAASDADGEDLRALAALSGTADALAGWSTAERLLEGLPASETARPPDPAPPVAEDDACATCVADGC